MKGHDDHKSPSNFHVTGYTFKRNISLLTGKTNKLENKSCGKWKNHFSSRAWKNHYYNGWKHHFLSRHGKIIFPPRAEKSSLTILRKITIQFEIMTWKSNFKPIVVIRGWTEQNSVSSLNGSRSSRLSRVDWKTRELKSGGGELGGLLEHFAELCYEMEVET